MRITKSVARCPSHLASHLRARIKGGPYRPRMKFLARKFFASGDVHSCRSHGLCHDSLALLRIVGTVCWGTSHCCVSVRHFAPSMCLLAPG